MKQQRSDAQIEVYKNVIDEVQDLKNKLSESDTSNHKLKMQIKTIEHELSESNKYKNAVDFLKEEIRKTKQDYHMDQLELQKQRSLNSESTDKYKRLEKKHQNLEMKHQ